ncbi:hypothetical protein [Halobellus rufus]|uniref:hypothetical protein n=1 Tax=Halobellus rufus TaxID=1448860 RepID=UPI0006798EF4|nr:hypothetical protein [Halobellus rufus]
MGDRQTTRRALVRSAAVGLGLGAVVTPVAGRGSNGGNRNGRGRGSNGGKTPLVDGAAEYRIYVATADGDDPVDTPEAFDYPGGPVLAGEDVGDGGLFDASDIEKTPNGQTLHHSLQFFQGLLIRKDRGKPYVMVHQGDGRFVSKGQSLNFEARSTEELRALFAAAGYPDLSDTEPFATLAGGRWRAVARDVVQFVGDPETSDTIAWSLTRVDFYTRGGGKPSFELSALYVIYPNLNDEGEPTTADPQDPTIRPILPPAKAAGFDLVEDGRANLGGQ